MTVLYLFTRLRFNWNEVDFSIFSTYGMVTNLIGECATYSGGRHHGASEGLSLSSLGSRVCRQPEVERIGNSLRLGGVGCAIRREFA